jgi:hypothetical protein
LPSKTLGSCGLRICAIIPVASFIIHFVDFVQLSPSMTFVGDDLEILFLGLLGSIPWSHNGPLLVEEGRGNACGPGVDTLSHKSSLQILWPLEDCRRPITQITSFHRQGFHSKRFRLSCDLWEIPSRRCERRR